MLTRMLCYCRRISWTCSPPSAVRIPPRISRTTAPSTSTTCSACSPSSAPSAPWPAAAAVPVRVATTVGARCHPLVGHVACTLGKNHILQIRLASSLMNALAVRSGPSAAPPAPRPAASRPASARCLPRAAPAQARVSPSKFLHLCSLFLFLDLPHFLPYHRLPDRICARRARAVQLRRGVLLPGRQDVRSRRPVRRSQGVLRRGAGAPAGPRTRPVRRNAWHGGWLANG